jgi:hypothetical protein
MAHFLDSRSESFDLLLLLLLLRDRRRLLCTASVGDEDT